MKNYKIQFTDLENEILNKIEEGNKKRGSLQSLYSYLLKNTDCGLTNLNISFKTLWKKFTRSHDKNLKETGLKERIYKLKELGLITIEKENGKNLYRITRGTTQLNNPTDFPTGEKHASSIENTELEEHSKKHKYINNIITIDIDTKSTAGFDYENYLATSEKVTNFSLALNKTRAILNEMRVKSLDIQSKVIDAVLKNYKNITVAGLENYIRAVIIQKRNKYYDNFNKYIAPKKFKKFTNFNNYTQREYTAKELEACL